MTYVITSRCDGCRHLSCIGVCPVDCFYDLGRRLVIDPQGCIDCEACAPECPEKAIFPDHALPEGEEASLAFNADKARAAIAAGRRPIISDMAPPAPEL